MYDTPDQQDDFQDSEQEDLWELRPPKADKVRTAPPLLISAEEEYEQAKTHGPPKEERRVIALMPDDPARIEEAYLQDLRELDFDESDLEEPPPDLSSQYAQMIFEPGLRLTRDFCEEFRIATRLNPSRHPCGETRAPWESWDQYSQRCAKESDWFRQIERSLVDPHSDRFWEVLCSRESYETKKKAVRTWIGWLAHHSRPVIYPDPKAFSFFGRHWSDTDAACDIRVTSEWRDHQEEGAAKREERRGDRPDHTALIWLKRNASKALKARAAPALKAKALERLEVLDWPWAEFKRQAKERGWI